MTLHSVHLFRLDGTRRGEMFLPFSPTPGIWVQAPWRPGNLVQIVKVCWIGDPAHNFAIGHFECYAAEEQES